MKLTPKSSTSASKLYLKAYYVDLLFVNTPWRHAVRGSSKRLLSLVPRHLMTWERDSAINKQQSCSRYAEAQKHPEHNNNLMRNEENTEGSVTERQH